MNIVYMALGIPLSWIVGSVILGIMQSASNREGDKKWEGIGFHVFAIVIGAFIVGIVAAFLGAFK